MTENPEFLATADLSPLSPSPIHTHISSPNLVPTLQDQADVLDVAAPDPVVAMDPNNQDSAEISDTIVVGGDYSDESMEGSDDSFDAYGEADEGQEQEDQPEAPNDDYARTFDSPAGQEQQAKADQMIQSDVSKDSESMNSSSTLNLKIKKSQSPIAPSTSSVLPSTSDLPPVQGAVQVEVQHPPSPSDEPVVSESPSEPPLSAAPTTSPSPAPALSSPARSGVDEIKDASAHAPTPTRSPPPTNTTTTSPTSANEDDAATVDIQKLVNDITARADATNPPSGSPKQATLASQATSTSSLNLSHHASLPPKPAVSRQLSHLPSIPQPRAPNSIPPLASSMSVANPPASRGGYLSGGAPGTTAEAISSLPPIPPNSFNSAQAPLHPLPPNIHPIPSSGNASSPSLYAPSTAQEWEAFMADEKRYTSEAKWERFPDGSRIFIGNLSSERVSKREVFNVFHKFGRLAQISLKNAFGFVQYHTADEGRITLQNAQGIELGGRKIHLEISRTKKKEERNRSPDRRDSRAGRGVERYETRDQNWRRDDYRLGARSPSPRRNDLRGGSRDGFYPRDREHGKAFDRRRSRSPPRYSRFEDSYRRRSPSPPRRAPPVESDLLDIPRRYGSDIPDVQLLLLQEVERHFVAWVQRAFHDRGLKTDVMFLSPRFPREAVVQRQVIEGVHAIVDLDYAAQVQNKLSIQVFKRSGGSNVHFESYQGIEPAIAAELVLREKSQAAPAVQPPPAAYPQPSYNTAYPAGSSTGYPYPYPHAPAPQAPVQPAPDLASMVGQLDNTALQALLASLQTNQTATTQQASHPGLPGSYMSAGGPHPSQVDIGLLLGNLRNPVPSQPAPTPALHSAPSYGSTPVYMSSGAGPVSPTGGIPNAAMVQNIMDQLKRAAQ